MGKQPDLQNLQNPLLSSTLKYQNINQITPKLRTSTEQTLRSSQVLLEKLSYL
jgi:hypothetical protein